MVNNEYMNNNKTSADYCVKKNDAYFSTVSSITTSSKAPDTTLKNDTFSSTTAPISKTTQSTLINNPDVKTAPNPAPASQHIWGGVFIPVIAVLGFIVGLFAVKKYNLIEKAHGYIRNRNQHQRYNGLMENEFDDDDPLLI